MSTEPLSSLITTRIDPATNFTTTAHFEGFVHSIDFCGLILIIPVSRYARASLQSIKHPIGTCAMAPQDLGGVVDSSLKVYGTANLRVVDASIFPQHLAAHTQATVYAVGEKVNSRARTLLRCSMIVTLTSSRLQRLSPREVPLETPAMLDAVV